MAVARGVRRNRGGQAPQDLQSTLFPGAKCPFLAWKMSLRLHFLAKGHFESMLFAENFFSFREKYHISGKFFSYLGKNVIYPENFFGMPGTFFWDDPPPPLPRRQHFREKISRCPFLLEKCPSKSGPSQLLEGSYAPGSSLVYTCAANSKRLSFR
jgi:hypothetical protein